MRCTKNRIDRKADPRDGENEHECDSGVGIAKEKCGHLVRLGYLWASQKYIAMPLRTFFEATGDLFELTFMAMPWIGPAANVVFWSIISGGILYWLREMSKHEKQQG